MTTPTPPTRLHAYRCLVRGCPLYGRWQTTPGEDARTTGHRHYMTTHWRPHDQPQPLGTPPETLNLT